MSNLTVSECDILVAAFWILFGFQIADFNFAFGFWFFLCLRFLVHMIIIPVTGVLSQIRREVTRGTEDFWTEGNSEGFREQAKAAKKRVRDCFPTGRSVRLFTCVDSRDSGDTAQEFTDC